MLIGTGAARKFIFKRFLSFYIHRNTRFDKTDKVEND